MSENLSFDLPHNETWMSLINDSVPLNLLSVPGTHDSCTYAYSGFFVGGWVVTQNMNIREQLESGIRYLDLRCSTMSDGTIYMCHGSYRFNLKLIDVLRDIKNFLESYPKECVIVSVKKEDEENHPVSDSDFIKYFNQAQNESGTNCTIWAENSIPNLGQVRGKIVVVSRVFGLSGLDYNRFDIEDWSYGYIFTNYIEKKEEMIKDHIWTSISDDSRLNRKIYLTYTSLNPGSDFFESCKIISDYLNGQVYQFFKDTYAANRCIGFVVMDFADSNKDLINSIIRFNGVFDGDPRWLSVR